ncbi:MAG: site-2 protease family protein, partial [Planctomycetota bacterium]
RVGGRTHLIVLGPTGGWTQPILPHDPPAHLVTSLSGPLICLSLAIAAACGLAFYGEPSVLPLLSPFAPEFHANVPLLHEFAQVFLWVNACLVLINLLPIHPCDGAELLRSLMWPLVGRPTASAAVAHIAYGAAAMTAVLALFFMKQHDDALNSFLPTWFPLAVLSVLLLYSGNRATRDMQYDAGLDIDELESDDEQWLNADWLEEDHAAVLVEQLQEKQQEAIDRKRREREDKEDARVDDILAMLNHTRFEDLSEEDQAILKRASRRYRLRRQSPENA